MQRSAHGSYVLYLELPVRIPNAISALADFKPRAARNARVRAFGRSAGESGDDDEKGRIDVLRPGNADSLKIHARGARPLS